MSGGVYIQALTLKSVPSGTDSLIIEEAGGAPDATKRTTVQAIVDLASGGGVSDGDKGDITVSGLTWTINPNVVTYAKIQDVSASDRILGRSTAGAGDIEEITCTAAGRALLDDANTAAQRATLGAVNIAGDTMTGQLILPSSGTNAPLNIGAWAADPGTLGTGDIWIRSNSALSWRGAGTTFTALAQNGTQSVTGKKNFSASTTSTAFLNLAHGSDPTTPTNGDTWTTTAAFKVQVNGATASLSGTNTGDETASGILAKLITVDGPGSNLDADTLDGTAPSAFGLSLIDDADATAGRATLSAAKAVTVVTGITAFAGGGQASATQLVGLDTIQCVSTVASANDSVKLPTPVAGGIVRIVNEHASNNVRVYPQSGHTLDGVLNGTDDIEFGQTHTFIAKDSTSWFVQEEKSYSTSNPVALGTASPGTSDNMSRRDHVHPAADLATSAVTGILPIANGGTNANSASGARTNLLPSKTGNALKVLRVNAGETDYEVATISGGSGLTHGEVMSRVFLA